MPILEENFEHDAINQCICTWHLAPGTWHHSFLMLSFLLLINLLLLYWSAPAISLALQTIGVKCSIVADFVYFTPKNTQKNQDIWSEFLSTIEIETNLFNICISLSLKLWLTFVHLNNKGLCKNKPAAQAASRDPFRCNSTNRQKSTHLAKLP